jgi:hypothetical protein
MVQKKPIVNLDDAMRDSVDDIGEDMAMIRRIKEGEDKKNRESPS